jgi:two-component system response regulator (stage 0 sporulation protein F)
MADTKRILVVDDEESLTFSLYQNFIMADFEGEVMTASSGEDAWEKLIEKDYNVVLTDIMMPGISGIELLQKIKLKNPSIKVVVMTAYPDNFKVEALGKGADGFLEKPFDNKEVRRLVMSLLDN